MLVFLGFPSEHHNCPRTLNHQGPGVGANSTYLGDDSCAEKAWHLQLPPWVLLLVFQETETKLQQPITVTKQQAWDTGTKVAYVLMTVKQNRSAGIPAIGLREKPHSLPHMVTSNILHLIIEGNPHTWSKSYKRI